VKATGFVSTITRAQRSGPKTAHLSKGAQTRGQGPHPRGQRASYVGNTRKWSLAARRSPQTIVLSLHRFSITKPTKCQQVYQFAKEKYARCICDAAVDTRPTQPMCNRSGGLLNTGPRVMTCASLVQRSSEYILCSDAAGFRPRGSPSVQIMVASKTSRGRERAQPRSARTRCSVSAKGRDTLGGEKIQALPNPASNEPASPSRARAWRSTSTSGLKNTTSTAPRAHHETTVPRSVRASSREHPCDKPTITPSRPSSYAICSIARQCEPTASTPIPLTDPTPPSAALRSPAITLSRLREPA